MDALKKYSGQPDIFVTFVEDVGKTSHPRNSNPKNASGFKFGINPSSDYDSTPIGIYAYPIDYVISLKRKVPYVSNKPFLQVFKAKGNFLYIVDYTDLDLNNDLEKIKYISQKLDWNKDEINLILSHAHSKNPAKTLWWIISTIAEYFMPGSSRKIVKWNTLFRMLGYDGVIDNGYGAIHTNEPTQAVFFSTKNLKLLEVIDNKKLHLIGFDDNDPDNIDNL